jgi:hypothetical protein
MNLLQMALVFLIYFSGMNDNEADIPVKMPKCSEFISNNSVESSYKPGY